ncbi:MAG: diguanylate cyclase [Anaerolineae bacterium]|jgi:diguanylate cyclase (GGDEF)-like protein
MELKTYIHILVKKWWIVIPTFLVTLTSGIVFTYTRTPIYKATTTYVVVPSSSFNDIKSFANGLDMLGRRAEIATTFAEIAASHRIKRLALDSLSLQSGRDYSVGSKLRAGTNIVEVTVEGPDPAVVQGLANAVGASIEEYVQGLYEVFVLVPLDEATKPQSPTSPNKPLNLTLAAVLGLVLGGGLAFLSEYLETPVSSATAVNIIDSETGVYNREYFLQRLSEEMARAKRNQYPLSLALIRIDNLSLLSGSDATKVRTDLLRQVAMLAGQYLRAEDIVARLEKDVLALLLPDMMGENAKALLEYLQTRIAWTPFQSAINGIKFNLKSSAGVTAYNHNGTSREELMAKASRALQLAEVEEDGKAFLMTDLTLSGDMHG